jgi:hypothetical protein
MTAGIAGHDDSIGRFGVSLFCYQQRDWFCVRFHVRETPEDNKDIEDSKFNSINYVFCFCLYITVNYDVIAA